jgi:hypothetical protein
VFPLVSEEHLDLDRAPFHSWGETLDRHPRERRALRGITEVRSRSRRKSDLKQSQGGDVHKTSPDAIGPEVCIRTCGKPDQRRLVDEPRGQCHA